ncbi:MAG TPA: hypothetical protein VFS69_04650 [Sphingomicrobium sp.]|nr:hypothetical protein [Sphingomicrobium sp.]
MKQELIEILRKSGRRIGTGIDTLRALKPGQSAEDVADVLIRAAGELEIAETRIW